MYTPAVIQVPMMSSGQQPPSKPHAYAFYILQYDMVCLHFYGILYDNIEKIKHKYYEMSLY